MAVAGRPLVPAGGGQPRVAGITAAGAVRAEAAGRALAVPVAGPQGAGISLTGRPAGGAPITALDAGAGGRD
ncbi:hypothetical protein ABZY44_20630 [Streptomyces sp. NPDC006544]|uniref:hypothetical protein n=1 Tax=Streptomyces sp. NPDC006544 TaxID=3154583 RepID=UPI0033BAF6C6